MALVDPYARDALHAASLHSARKTLMSTQISEHRQGIKRLAASLTAEELPSPGVIKALQAKHTTAKSQFPTPFECVVHLELLEVINVLKYKVIRSYKLDRFFKLARENETNSGISGTGWILKKWDFFVSFAIVRFRAWVKVMDSNYWSFTSDKTWLPPLDVLMIWLAFQLYRGSFTTSSTSFWNRDLPWLAIHHVIDRLSCTYNVPKAVQVMFKRLTGLPFDLLDFMTNSDTTEELPVTAIRLLSPGRPSDDPISADSTLETLEPPQLRIMLGMAVPNADDEAFPQSKQLRDATRTLNRLVAGMAHKIWLRSPSVVRTVERAILRYEHIIELCAIYPKRQFIPTLDVVLIWYTHKSMPARHRQFEVALGKCLLDLYRPGSEIQNPPKALQETAGLYRAHFVDEYATCLCWDCELVKTISERDDERTVKEKADEVKKEVARHRDAEVARRLRTLAAAVEARKEHQPS